MAVSYPIRIYKEGQIEEEIKKRKQSGGFLVRSFMFFLYSENTHNFLSYLFYFVGENISFLLKPFEADFFLILTLLASFRLAFKRKYLISLISRGILALFWKRISQIFQFFFFLFIIIRENRVANIYLLSLSSSDCCGASGFDCDSCGPWTCWRHHGGSLDSLCSSPSTLSDF